jgi:hypothetical protein
MPMNLLHRSVVGSAILLTALLAGCRDDPAPAPDNRATQVAPKKEDKPVAEKATPSAAATSRATTAPAEKPAAAPNASAAPSASAAVAAPAAPADPALDCDKILTLEDVSSACNVKVEAPADQPTEDIGSEPRCVRKFNSKDAGLLTLIVLRHASADEAKERYSKDFTVELSKPERVEGAGDLSHFFLKKGVSGDPILTVEAVKERFNVTLFNPKVTVGGQTVGPVCDQKALGKLLVKALEHIT